jgi:hypothetical protein
MDLVCPVRFQVAQAAPSDFGSWPHAVPTIVVLRIGSGPLIAGVPGPPTVLWPLAADALPGATTR